MGEIKREVAEIVREGKKIILPEDMSYDRAISDLQKRKEYEETQTEIIEEIKCFVWDGAWALQKAIAEIFGWADAQSIPGGFFSPDQKPKMIKVETGVDSSVLVPWGRFGLPGVEGYIETSMAGKDEEMPTFLLRAIVKRKHADLIQKLASLTRKIVEDESIYRGKAIKIKFKDSRRQYLPLPMPSFLDTKKTKIEEIIFSKEVESSVQGNLFTPIRNRELCNKYKIPLKRGILLSGKYGTGKTLVANATAKVCEENDWSFIMCERADELKDVLSFARQYQPAVVFCEDIDREMNGEERTTDMDGLLNTIDGIESKSTEIIVVLTTNHAENINRAMMRPGRLDAVINVLPPDAKAVEKLIRLYGRGLVPENSDLTAVGQALDGKIPAVIRECIERSKLYAIASGNLNGKKIVISGENLLESAMSMKNQLDLLDGEKPKQVNPFDAFADGLAKKVREEMEHEDTTLKNVAYDVCDIKDHTC